MDCVVAYHFFHLAVTHGVYHYWYFGLTVTFVLLPSLTMTGFSLRWYLQDAENAELPEVPTWRWILRILMLLLQVCIILTYFLSVHIFKIKIFKIFNFLFLFLLNFFVTCFSPFFYRLHLFCDTLIPCGTVCKVENSVLSKAKLMILKKRNLREYNESRIISLWFTKTQMLPFWDSLSVLWKVLLNLFYKYV